MGGETKIERRIERLYTLDDPHFMHELGVLLGPPFLQGTKARALLQGVSAGIDGALDALDALSEFLK